MGDVVFSKTAAITTACGRTTFPTSYRDGASVNGKSVAQLTCGLRPQILLSTQQTFASQMEGEEAASSMNMQAVHLLADEQLLALHQQMVESQASCRHKLQSSQEAQHRQAILIQKLQAKVLQYRNWCKELEQHLKASRDSHTSQQGHREYHGLEKALIQLEEEQQRCENLAGVNILLRKHLDKANEVNEALREDISKLTADWTRARDELEFKESEWRKEQEFFESYRRAEHDRIFGIWRQVVALRRYFLEMKTATDRDLSELKAEQVRLSGPILVNCFQLYSDTQHWATNSLANCVWRGQVQEQQSQMSPEKIDMEKEIYQQAQSIMSLHVKGELVKEDLQNRVIELTALLEKSQKENEENEKNLKTLRDSLHILEANRLEMVHEQSLSKNVNEEILSLQHVIKEISQAMINESGAIVCSPEAENHGEPCSSFQQKLGDPGDTLFLVREVLRRRSSEVQHLKQQLLTSQNTVSSLEKQEEQHQEYCCLLRGKVEQLEQERDTLADQLQHLQITVDTFRSDHASLEKSQKELQQQLEVLEQEAYNLRRSNTELQLKGDMMNGENEEQQQELERMLREKEHLQEDQTAREEKHSLLRNELLARREQLKKSRLDEELLKQEKHELASALEQAERSLADLTSVHNKLKAETADQHNVTAKMSALNEALALDKVGLNQLILKLEQENHLLLDKMDYLEKIRISSKKEFNQIERTNEELRAEKIQLKQLLHKAEELQESLQDELSMLRNEQKEICENLNKLHHQHQISIKSLEQAHQESCHLKEALTKMSQEKEILMREKTTLEVRLGALERERLTLTEQVEDFRLAKELLESSLFQTQQQVSQLEIDKGHLEMKVQAITQAKEVIQGEVQCLQTELEMEKSKTEQEREEKAQQLSEAEQKFQETLNNYKIVHKEEMNTVFQELEFERECHHMELEKAVQRMVKEKEDTESLYERKLQDLQQEVTAVRAQMENELMKTQNARQQMLLEKESERKSLLGELFQTKEELDGTRQQLEYLHQELKNHQGKEQDTVHSLETDLKDAQNTVEKLEQKHREEIKSLKEEINALLQHQDALQNQIQDLESQLSTAKESCQLLNLEAQQHVRKMQELSKQKELAVTHLQQMLEAERKQREKLVHQNVELQSQKEEMERRNRELHTMLQNQWEAEKHLNRELKRKQEDVEHLQNTLEVLEKEQRRWVEAEQQNSKQCSMLQKQWDEAMGQNKQLQSKKEEAEARNIELQHQKEELEGHNVQLKVELQKQQETAEQERIALRLHWEEAQQKCSELQNWKEKAEVQNTELQALLCSQREELQCRIMELQTKQKEMEEQDAALQKMKKEPSQWEEVECQNSELKATLQILEQERASLALLLEEKGDEFQKLQDKDNFHRDEITRLNTALHQAEQLLAAYRRDMQELKTQIQTFKQTGVEKEAALVAHKEQLTQDLEVSRASEQRLKDTTQMLEAEVSKLRLSLHSTESRAETLASECQHACSARWEAQSQLTKLCSVLQYMLCNSPDEKLEHGDQRNNISDSLSLSREQDNVMGLSSTQTKDFSRELTVEKVAEAIQNLRQALWQIRLERDEIRKNSEKLKQELNEKIAERDRADAKAQELQKWFSQNLQEKNTAEGKRISLESALKAQVIAFKEENVTLHGKVAILEKTLESTEKQKMDMLNERDNLQMAKENMSREVDFLRESVRTSEIRASAIEKMNQSLEQELQTTLSTLRIKEEEVDTHKEKLKTLQQEAGVGKVSQENLDHLTVMLGKRNEEIKTHLRQIKNLERYGEMQKATIEHLTENLEKKSQETESQKDQIKVLRKENEMQKTAFERANLDLEKKIQCMEAEQEKIQTLEELAQTQRIMVENLTLTLEEKVKETKIMEEKIQVLQENKSSEIESLMKELNDLKTQLSEKDWELASQKQLLQQQEEQGGKREKTLQISLEHMKAILRDKEREVEFQGDQIMSFQQCEAQKEGHLHELHERVKQLAFTVTKRDGELESQKQQIVEREGELELERKALHELIAKTQISLKDKITELEFQRKHEEEVAQHIRILFRDVQYSTAVLKEKNGSSQLQEEQFRKQHTWETTIGMLGQLRVMLKGREEEIKFLKEQQKKHKEEKERIVIEMQTNLQQALRSGEGQIESIKEENRQLQQREEKATTEKNSILEKLENTTYFLQERDRKIESLEKLIKELAREKEMEQSKIASLQQNLNRIQQLMSEKEELLIKQAEEISTYQLKVEITLTELKACQNQASHLEAVIKQKEQDREEDLQKLQYKHEQVKEDDECLWAEEEFQEGEQNKREKEVNIQDDKTQKQMKDEIKKLQESIQCFQRMLKKKADEVEWQRGKAEQLDERVKSKEKELLACKEQLKEITFTLSLQDDNEGSNLKNQSQKLLMWKEEEKAMREALQEKNQQLEWQKEQIQHLENEKNVKKEELDHMAAILKKTESGEIEWRERAQKLGLSLAKSEEAMKVLREEMAIVQSMVSQRDKDRFHLQEQLDTTLKALEEERLITKALDIEKEGVLPWVAQKTFLHKRLQLLQQVIAKLENDKQGLEQRNTQLRDALEQVERERRRLKKSCGKLSPSFGLSQGDSDLLKTSSFEKEKTLALHKQLAEFQKQVSVLQEQLTLERKQKQDYIDSCAKRNKEISSLHQELSDSLAVVAREPEATVLELETYKLDESLNHSLALAGVSWDCLLSEKHLISSTPKNIPQNSR